MGWGGIVDTQIYQLKYWKGEFCIIYLCKTTPAPWPFSFSAMYRMTQASLKGTKYFWGYNGTAGRQLSHLSSVAHILGGGDGVRQRQDYQCHGCVCGCRVNQHCTFVICCLLFCSLWCKFGVAAMVQHVLLYSNLYVSNKATGLVICSSFSIYVFWTCSTILIESLILIFDTLGLFQLIFYIVMMWSMAPMISLLCTAFFG